MNCKYINRKDPPLQDCTISKIGQEKQKDTKLHCFNANRTHTSHPHLHFPRLSQRKRVTIFFSEDPYHTLANQRLPNFFLQKEHF